MLVITRKRSEAIRIGEDIRLKVIEIGEGVARLRVEVLQDGDPLWYVEFWAVKGADFAIGDQARSQITSFDGSRIRIGIVADRTLFILRDDQPSEGGEVRGH